MKNGRAKSSAKKKIAKLDRLSVTHGSGDIFKDLGFTPAEAGELGVKAELTRRIVQRIRQMHLTQADAGQRLGLSQPDVSKLMRGRVTGYSSDRLMALLNALDVDVEIVLRPHSLNSRSGPGVIRVAV